MAVSMECDTCFGFAHQHSNEYIYNMIADGSNRCSSSLSITYNKQANTQPTRQTINRPKQLRRSPSSRPSLHIFEPTNQKTPINQKWVSRTSSPTSSSTTWLSSAQRSNSRTSLPNISGPVQTAALLAPAALHLLPPLLFPGETVSRTRMPRASQLPTLP